MEYIEFGSIVPNWPVYTYIYIYIYIYIFNSVDSAPHQKKIICKIDYFYRKKALVSFACYIGIFAITVDYWWLKGIIITAYWRNPLSVSIVTESLFSVYQSKTNPLITDVGVGPVGLYSLTAYPAAVYKTYVPSQWHDSSHIYNSPCRAGCSLARW